MENAVDALKIAFAVMMFVMALGLSISSFSDARLAAASIINMSDRETEYTYIESSDNFLTRTVGIETIIPSVYRAYTENIEIYFFRKDGTPLYLYYKTDTNGEKVIENGNHVKVNYIDLSLENFSTAEEAINHLDILLSGKDEKGKYENQLIYKNNDNLYNFLKGKVFTEELGEYYQGNDSTKIKKRVITYRCQNY